jgi:hypothetical protein
MAAALSRIDLLELDIDLRIRVLWREVGQTTEWNLEKVASFMRAAYVKGYADALVEESRGQLCSDYGYQVPSRRQSPPVLPDCESLG